MRRWLLVSLVLAVIAPASAARAASCPAANGDAYSTAVLADSPSAYYRLDESTGTTLCDSSASAANGTYNGSGITYGVAGALVGDSDTAIAADGSSGVIGTGGASPVTGNHSFTLEGWYRQTGTTQNQAVVDIGGASSGHIAGLTTWSNLTCSSQTSASELGLDLFAASNCWDTSGAGVNLYDGSWHYLVVSYDSVSGKVTGYVDGQSLGAQTPGAAINLDASSIRVGYWVDTVLNQPYKGGADEVAVYGSALSAARIQAHWQAGQGAAPQNISRPQIAGTPAVGQALSCSQGSWTNSPSNFTYAWNRDGLPIGGAASSGYTVSQADAGHALTCTVAAFNNFGNGSATSDPVNVPPPPHNTAVPQIVGNPQVGQTLTCTTGSWTGNPTFKYTWARDTQLIAGYPGSGVSSNAYTVVQADAGHMLNCNVIASNDGGSTVSTSFPVKVPASTPPPKNTAVPHIVGTAAGGQTVTCNPGSWTGSPTFRYTWAEDSKLISGYPAAGVASSTFPVSAAEAGHTLNCNVIASNGGGSTISTSFPVKVAPLMTATQCTNPRTGRVTCSNPSGLPGVCAPTGPVYPQCQQPVPAPTVCGGSGVNGLAVCQSQGPSVMACGSTGLGLSACPPSPTTVPNICGPAGSGLAPCTSANSPITVCGPSITVVGQCSFTTTIKAVPNGLNGTQPGELDLTLSCPNAAGVAGVSSDTRASAAAKATQCQPKVDLDSLRQDLINTETSAAMNPSIVGEQWGFAQAVYCEPTAPGDSSFSRRKHRRQPHTIITDVNGPPLYCPSLGLHGSQLAHFAHFDEQAFTQRAEALIKRVLGGSSPPPDLGDGTALFNELYNKIGSPNYALWEVLVAKHAPPGKITLDSSYLGIQLWVIDFVKAVSKYRTIYLKQRPQAASTDLPSANSAASNRCTMVNFKPVLHQRIRLQTSHRHTVRIRFSRAQLRTLESCMSRRQHVLPLRLVVSFAAKPRPIVRFVDFPLRIR